MNIVKAIKSNRITKKLDNGLTEIKHEATDRTFKSHYFLDENREYQGEYKSWYDDGTPREHCFFKDGEFHGEFKRWYPTGTLREHCFFKDGDLQGEFKWWDDDETLGDHCFYKDGKIIEDYLI